MLHAYSLTYTGAQRGGHKGVRSDGSYSTGEGMHDGGGNIGPKEGVRECMTRGWGLSRG